MKFLIILAICSSIIIFVLQSARAKDGEGKQMNQSIYEFKVNTMGGKEVSLSKYKNKVLLIVNVASYCGFTKQYEGLQNLYIKYHDKGLEILGFPCNQFGEQEPGTNEEIKQFCSTNYGVTFQLFDKIEVNGDNTHPLYKYLKSAKPGFLNENIKWNFTKFLVDRQGNVIDRFWSKTTPESLAPVIEELLGK